MKRKILRRIKCPAQDDTKDVILRRRAPKNLHAVSFHFGLGLLLLAITVLSIVVCGCASSQFDQLKRKLIRQKKEKIKPVQFLEEPVRRKNREYYEEHILYFKTWNDTLIEFLGKNRKREVQSAREAERHLSQLPKYLEPEYADKLQAIVLDYETLVAPLKMKSLPTSRNSIVAQELNRLQLRVHRNFSFKEVKDHLLPDATRIDLSAYQDDTSVTEPTNESTQETVQQPEPSAPEQAV